MRLHLDNKRASLWIVLALFSLVILFVNPLRETAMEDDWAYALTVRHLLETGNHQLHDWLGPNMLFQAYWGGLFARLLGYSFSSLRISTLCLAVLALTAFYYLAREHGVEDVPAGLLTLGLLASPLVLRFSFNFMTDIPFLTCLVVALYLYTRAIRLHSYVLMLFGSVAACAAILTRQLGVVLILGLFLVWVLGHTRKQQVLFFLTGVVLPALAALWQVAVGYLRPNWAARYLALSQAHYFANPGVVLVNMLWRPAVFLQYVALFSLPFVFVALLASALHAFSALDGRVRRLLLRVLIWLGLGISILTLAADSIGIGQAGFGAEQILMFIGGICLSVASGWLLRSSHPFGQTPTSGRGLLHRVILLGVFALYILAAIVCGHWANHSPILMPYLSYNFDALKHMPMLLRVVFTLITATGAAALARIFALRYSEGEGWGGVPPAARLLDFVTLFLLLLQLPFVHVADEYLVDFLPFTLIVIGRHLGKRLNRYRMVTALACLAMLVMLVASAMWTRGLLEIQEAYWQGAESVRTAGVHPNQIFGTWTWVSYYRFDEYMAEVRGREMDSVADYFYRWLPEQQEHAQFWIRESVDAPADEKWEVLKEMAYQDTLLREKRVYVVRREKSR